MQKMALHARGLVLLVVLILGSGVMLYFSSNNSPTLGYGIELDQTSTRPSWAILAACRDRLPFIRSALPTWLAVDGVAEIVVVDWTSQVPLAEDPVIRSMAEMDPRVHIVRVEGETSWALSRAVNVALRMASAERMIKLDCDSIVSSDFAIMHPLEDPRTYYAGDYRRARIEAELHLNGVVIASQAAFRGVGGYDERIQRYGWDDTDLHTRFNKSEINFKPINLDLITHIPHGDDVRQSSNSDFGDLRLPLEPQTLANGELLSLLHPWNASSQASNYEILSMGGASTPRVSVLRAIYKPAPIEEQIPAQQVEIIRRKWALTYIGYVGYKLDPLRTQDNKFIFGLLDLVWERARRLPIFTVHLEGTGMQRWRTMLSACSVAITLERYLRLEWRGGDTNANRIPGNFAAFWSMDGLPFGGESVDHIDRRELEPVNNMLFDADSGPSIPSGRQIYERHVHLRSRGQPVAHPAGRDAYTISNHCVPAFKPSPSIASLMEARLAPLPADVPYIGLVVMQNGLTSSGDAWKSVADLARRHENSRVLIAAPWVDREALFKAIEVHLPIVAAAGRVHVVSQKNQDMQCFSNKDALVCWEAELADMLVLSSKACSVRIAGDDDGTIKETLAWLSSGPRRSPACTF